MLARELKASGDDMSKHWAFTEDSDQTVDGKMRRGPDFIPVAMRNMEGLGVPNPIIEVDLDLAGGFPPSLSCCA